tara:strand:+ start:9420 stop:10427 length:1008 start_codon:yes stop_codon:yes gene_type:complete
MINNDLFSFKLAYMENILITGITGQDGIFLVKNLLKNNNKINIFGTSRNTNLENFYKKLESIEVHSSNNLQVFNVDLCNSIEVNSLVKNIEPNKVFNLAGPSSVYDSYKNPKETLDHITQIYNNLVSALISENNYCNFFQASSSEMFVENQNGIIDENSLISANSPYAEAKIINHRRTLDLIDKYDWNIVSGIMFNHESEFRNSDYLTSKVINSAFSIYNKKSKYLSVGSLEYVRDWSFAGDIMEAADKLVYENAKGTYILGSGSGRSIKDLVQLVFDYFDLDWEKYIRIDKELLRPGDPKIKISNPKKIYDEFGWKANTSFKELIYRCIEKKIK